MLDCTEYYKINNAAAGVVLTDAAFITALSGKARRVVFGSIDGGFPPIKCALGVESLITGIAVRTPGFCVLSGFGGGLDVNEDKYIFPVPFAAIGTTELAGDADERGRRYDENSLNMPWPEGSSLCDGTVSKLFGCGANTYEAFVLYRQFGPKCALPKGGRVVVVSYDKGSDNTAIQWSDSHNGVKNDAGELLVDHNYRLLYISSVSEDDVTNLIRVTVPGFPPLIAPGCGGVVKQNATYGGAMKVYFLDDSVTMRGDAVHKVEMHIGLAQQPVTYIGWEDMGKR